MEAVKFITVTDKYTDPPKLTTISLCGTYTPSLMNQTTPSAALDVLQHQHTDTSSAAEGVVWFMRLIHAEG